MKNSILIFFLCISSAYLWQDISSESTTAFHQSKAKYEYKVPLDLDCSFRELAIDYSQILLSGGGYEYIYEALNLSECSGVLANKKMRSVRINENNQHPAFPKKSEKRQSTVEYYVSPDGNDNNPGTFSQPFQTIHRARDQIRISQRIQRFPTTVFLREGTYYLGDLGTFTLNPDDSGTFDSPIVYTNYIGESVLLSGGVKLELNWKPYQNGIWIAPLPSNISDFNTLFVAGSREIRARFPNGDPSIPYDGYTSAAGGFPVPDLTDIDQPQRQTTWPVYQTLYGGSVSRFTAFNSPNYDSRISYGLYYNDSTFSQKKWQNPNTGIVHIMHPYGWGSWMYAIENRDYINSSLIMSTGGWQEARGGPIIGGQPFYVENIFEELDAEREWYSDGSYLYYYPPPTININDVTVVAALLDCVLNIRGFADDPVQFVEFSGFNISHTASTFMKPYEVPSGGDYSVHRGGAVFIEGAANIIVDAVYYDQVGGNGVFLSNYAVNCSIVNSEFYLTGDNAIAAVGTSNLVMASQNAPNYNLIAYNHIHDFGNYGKQSSAYFQSIAHHNSLIGNVIYNGPRAGICFNDGFIGGDIISYNLLFNLVRESGDHGPFNSWDRVPYLYGSPDGTVATETHFITNNFIINRNFLGGTYGTRTLDHDDGSTGYTDSGNLLLYGSVKFRDGCNRTADDNLIVNDEIMSSEMQFLCNFTDTSKEIFANNTVVIYEPAGLAYECYELPPNSVKNPPFISMYNQFYTPLNSSLPFTVVDDCPGAGNITTLQQWQALGFDQFSTISSSITNEQILAIARTKIGMN